jgi:tetratricopeptide (TPR) repeat protein
VKPVLKSRQNTVALLALALVLPLAGMAGSGCNTAARSQPVAVASPTPTPMTPKAMLDSIPVPDPGTETAVAKEVTKWRDAARKEPTKPALWVNLGDALMQRQRELVDPHYYDWARQSYEQALQLDPKRAPALSGMAWVTGGLHQFDDSIAWAQKAIAVKSGDPAPYGLIGDAQVELGDYDGALQSYQKMLDIRPDIASYSRGAHLLFLTGDIRKAIWLMDKAVKAGAPYGENTAWCRAQLAEMLWSIGAILPAESVCKEAMKTAPNNYHVLTMMGRIKEARHDIPGAMECYQKAIAVSPQHAALVALGDLYLATGKKEEAEKQFRLVELAHQHHQTHGNHDELYLARFYADHDRNIPRALEIVDKRRATKGEPKGMADADTCAWVYFKAGKQDEAKRYIDLALAKNAPDAARLFHAGMIYAKAGEDLKAQKFLFRALELNPSFNAIQAKVAESVIKEIGSRPTPKKTASR